MFHNNIFTVLFDQINSAFQTHKKILPTLNFWTVVYRQFHPVDNKYK